MATERKNLQKNIKKSEAIRGMKQNFAEMFITLASTKLKFFIAVAHVLIMRKVKIGLYCYLTAGACILTERFYKCSLSSKEVVQIPHFNFLPWQLKV